MWVAKQMGHKDWTMIARSAMKVVFQQTEIRLVKRQWKCSAVKAMLLKLLKPKAI